jgi:hypothetical protein
MKVSSLEFPVSTFLYGDLRVAFESILTLRFAFRRFSSKGRVKSSHLWVKILQISEDYTQLYKLSAYKVKLRLARCLCERAIFSDLLNAALFLLLHMMRIYDED